MISPKRATVVAAALLTAVALFAAACSSNKSDTTTAGGGTTVAGASGIDYASLSGTLNGSGATFPKAFDEDAIAALQDVAPGVTVNYAGGGSGKGKTDLAGQVVQWAGSDSTVKDEDMANFKGGAFLYFPTVAAPITVSYNLERCRRAPALGPDTLAKIFRHRSPPGTTRPSPPTTPASTLPSTADRRGRTARDGSGTTSNFTKYLKAAAARLDPRRR